MCVRNYDYQVPYGVIDGDGSKVISMKEKPVHQFFINAGIYVISPEILKTMTKNVKIDMPTLLQEKINEGATVAMSPVHEYWLDNRWHSSQNE